MTNNHTIDRTSDHAYKKNNKINKHGRSNNEYSKSDDTHLKNACQMDASNSKERDEDECSYDNNDNNKTQKHTYNIISNKVDNDKTIFHLCKNKDKNNGKYNLSNNNKSIPNINTDDNSDKTLIADKKSEEDEINDSCVENDEGKMKDAVGEKYQVGFTIDNAYNTLPPYNEVVRKK